MNDDDLLDRAVNVMRRQRPPGDFPADRMVRHVLSSDRQLPHAWGLRFARGAMSTRYRIAALIALLIGSAAFLVFTRLSGSVALGEAIDQFRNATRMTARITVIMPGKPPVIQRAMFLGQDRFRSESGAITDIVDTSRGFSLTLDAGQKTATIVHMDRTRAATRPATESESMDWFTELKQLRKDQCHGVGGRIIDGAAVEGFQVKKAGFTLLVWVDVQARFPRLIEITGGADGSQGPKVVMDQITLDPPLAESLFDLAVPPGYTVQDLHFRLNEQPIGEADLIAFLSKYAELSGGRFPAALGGAQWGQAVESLKQNPTTQPTRQQLMDFAQTATRAIVFVNKLDKGWEYHGANARFGDANAPVFEYHPDGPAGMRIIYGDLHCRDVAP